MNRQGRSSFGSWRLAGALLSGLLVLSSSAGFGLGERQNIRGVGMGRTYVATARGLEAVGLNPANLAVDPEGVFSVGLTPVGFRVGGDVLTYGVYKTYFSDAGLESGLSEQRLEEADKEEILSRFTDGVGSSYANYDARLIGISLRIADAGVLALTINDCAGATMALPEDMVRFMLYGNPLGSEYDFSKADLSASWMRGYGLSFGTQIHTAPIMEWFAIGGGVKFVQGFAYYEIIRSNTLITTSDYGDLSGKIDFLSRVSESSTLKATGFDLFPVPAGEGWGVDVGLSAGITRFLSVGLSMTDIGSITWTRNTEEVFNDTSFVLDNPLDPDQREFLLDAIGGDQRRHVDPFTVHLPTTVRAGLSFALHETPLLSGSPAQLLFGIDVHKTLYNVPGYSTKTRISIGSEFLPVQWLPLRTGVSVGGSAGTTVAVGFGIRAGFFAIDVATENVIWLFAPAGSQQGSFSAGATLTF